MLRLEDTENLLVKRQATYDYSLNLQVIGDLQVTSQRTVFISKKILLMQKEHIEIQNFSYGAEWIKDNAEFWAGV